MQLVCSHVGPLSFLADQAENRMNMLGYSLWQRHYRTFLYADISIICVVPSPLTTNLFRQALGFPAMKLLEATLVRTATDQVLPVN